MIKPDFATEKDRHEWVISHAEYFTTAIFLGRGKYERVEHKDLLEAGRYALKRSAETGKKVMIYAVVGTSDTLVRTV